MVTFDLIIIFAAIFMFIIIVPAVIVAAISR